MPGAPAPMLGAEALCFRIEARSKCTPAVSAEGRAGGGTGRRSYKLPTAAPARAPKLHHGPGPGPRDGDRRPATPPRDGPDRGAARPAQTQRQRLGRRRTGRTEDPKLVGAVTRLPPRLVLRQVWLMMHQ
jgi:hypothetical protein